MEIKQKLDDNERSLVDNEKRLKYWQDKHGQLQLHQIDDDESENGDQAAEGKEDKQEGADKEENEEEDEPLDLQEYPEDELRAIDKESIKAEIVVYEGTKEKVMVESRCLREHELTRLALVILRHDYRKSAERPRQPFGATRVPQA